MPTLSPVSAAATARPARPADSPEEAAKQFEAVLVRQFVEVMTKDLFQSGQEGMLTGQADLQRDTLTDTLTTHLVDSGAFGVADLMMAQWERAGRVPQSEAAAPTDGAPRRQAPDAAELRGAPASELSMIEALRRYPPAQALPTSIDTSSEDLP